MKIDIGDLCTHCGRDTSFQSGNGLFVNRIPSKTDDKSGYMCPDCQYNDLDYCVECDECSELTLEYEILNDEQGTLLCPNCIEKREVKL